MNKNSERGAQCVRRNGLDSALRRRSHRIAIIATLAFASTSIAHAAIPDSERSVLLDLYASTMLDDVAIFQSTGGLFDVPGAVDTAPAGSANVSFQGCTAMTVSYAFTSGENAGRTGTM
jgi:hypothetical protein